MTPARRTARSLRLVPLLLALAGTGCRSRAAVPPLPESRQAPGSASDTTSPGSAPSPDRPGRAPATGDFGVGQTDAWAVPDACAVPDSCEVRRPTLLACTASNLLAPALVAGITAYGFAQWDYGSAEFDVASEGWFGHDADYGGADKLGHAVAANIFTSGLAALHQSWGFDRREGARRALLATGAGLLAMEVGDGFSQEHGFSFEDLAFDALGCAFGYLHATDPRFAELLDLRWEHWPSSNASEDDRLDPATAYESSAYVLALNVGALSGRRDLFLDLLDVQVGYRVRDLDAGPSERRQELLLGVGLNLTNLCRRLGAGSWCHVFDVWQPPWLSLHLAIDLND